MTRCIVTLEAEGAEHGRHSGTTSEGAGRPSRGGGAPVSRETFYLKIEVETEGEENDAVYQWLTNKLFEIDGVVDITELPDPKFTGDDS